MHASDILNNKEVLAAFLGGIAALVVPRMSAVLGNWQRRAPSNHRRGSLPSWWWIALLASCLSGACVHGAKEAIRSGPLSIPLKRQEIPLHSSGGVVQHKSAYYGQISVGGPQSQPFEVVFDTGSGHLVLPSTMCRSKTCLQHRRYKKRSSLLAEDIDVDGTPVRPGQMRDQITVSFGTGEVTGVFVRDRMCLGTPEFPEPSVTFPEAEPGSSLLQVGKINARPNATAQVSESDEEAPATSISAADALALAAAAKGQIPKAGPALDSLRAAAKVAYPRQVGDGCVDLRLVATTDMSEDPFSSFDFDGVLGMGLSGLSQTSEFNFLQTAAASGAWDPMPGAELTFAVFLAINDEEQSEITFGGWQTSRLRDGEDLAWNQVQDPALGYWQLEVFGITANGIKINFCDEGCRAVVDTGTSLLGVPSTLGRDLAAMLRHNASAQGLCDAPGPTLEIDLGNFTIVLDPVDYARPEMAGQELLASAAGPNATANEGEGGDNFTSGACIPMLMHIDLPQPLSPKTLILGEPVLQRYYTAFDAGAKRIGFAQARRDSTKRPARVFSV